jgi:hypothetical protein
MRMRLILLVKLLYMAPTSTQPDSPQMVDGVTDDFYYDLMMALEAGGS